MLRRQLNKAVRRGFVAHPAISPAAACLVPPLCGVPFAAPPTYTSWAWPRADAVPLLTSARRHAPKGAPTGVHEGKQNDAMQLMKAASNTVLVGVGWQFRMGSAKDSTIGDAAVEVTFAEHYSKNVLPVYIPSDHPAKSPIPTAIVDQLRNMINQLAPCTPRIAPSLPITVVLTPFSSNRPHPNADPAMSARVDTIHSWLRATCDGLVVNNVRFLLGDDAWSLVYALHLDASRAVRQLPTPTNLFQAYEQTTNTPFCAVVAAESAHAALIATAAPVHYYRTHGVTAGVNTDKEGAAVQQITCRTTRPVHVFSVHVDHKASKGTSTFHVYVYDPCAERNHAVSMTHPSDADKLKQLSSLLAHFGPGHTTVVLPTSSTNQGVLTAVLRGLRLLNPVQVCAWSALEAYLGDDSRSAAACDVASAWYGNCAAAFKGPTALHEAVSKWVAQRAKPASGSYLAPPADNSSYDRVREFVLSQLKRSLPQVTVGTSRPAAAAAAASMSSIGQGKRNLDTEVALQQWTSTLYNPARLERERKAAEKLARWLVLDLETTTFQEYKRRASPFTTKNRIVLPGLLDYKDEMTMPAQYCSQHGEYKLPDLAAYDVLVGHNIKFDLLHLWRDPNLVAFLKRGGMIWDTMYAEFLLTGHVVKLGSGAGLESVARSYGGTVPKLDAVKAAWDKGIDTPDIPHATLAEYLEGDLRNTKLVFVGQLSRAIAQHQVQIIMLRMDGLLCTTEMEFNGLKIDQKLSIVQHEALKKETAALKRTLEQHVPAEVPPLCRSQFNFGSIPLISAMFFGGSIEFNPIISFDCFRKPHTKLHVSDGVMFSCRCEADLCFLAANEGPKATSNFVVPYLRSLGLRTTGVLDDYFNLPQISGRYVVSFMVVDGDVMRPNATSTAPGDAIRRIGIVAYVPRVVESLDTVTVTYTKVTFGAERTEADPAAWAIRLVTVLRVWMQAQAPESTWLLFTPLAHEVERVLRALGVDLVSFLAGQAVQSIVLAESLAVVRHALKHCAAVVQKHWATQPHLSSMTPLGAKKRTLADLDAHIIQNEQELLNPPVSQSTAISGMIDAASRLADLVVSAPVAVQSAYEAGVFRGLKKPGKAKPTSAAEARMSAEASDDVPPGFTIGLNPFASKDTIKTTGRVEAGLLALLRYCGSLTHTDYTPFSHQLIGPLPPTLVELPSRLDSIIHSPEERNAVRVKFYSELSKKQSVNEEALEFFQKHNDKVAELILNIRQREKQLSTYYDDKATGMLSLVHANDSCIHHELLHNKTTTGRLASANPNCQNIPKEDRSPIRELFVSRFTEPDGSKTGICIEADYSQLEVVTLCALSHDAGMTADLKNNVDFHCKRVALMRPEYTYQHVIQKAKKEKDPEFVKMRQAAKIFSFQRQYGAGVKKISESTGLSAQAVKQLIDAEAKEYAGVDLFYDMVKLSCTTFDATLQDGARNAQGHSLFKGMFPVLTGSRYVFTEANIPTAMLREGEKATNFSPTHIRNYPVQGFAGEIVQIMIGILWRHFVAKDHYGGKALLTNTVHDCVWVDTLPELKLEVARDMKRIMSDVRPVLNKYYPEMQVEVEFPVEVVAGENMGHMHGIKNL